MKFVKTIVTPIAVFLAFALILTGANVFAAPLIEQNGSAQALAPLFEAMPGAKAFTQLYGGETTTLADVPATVKAVYQEDNGLGYAVNLSTTEGYTKEPMEFTLAVDPQGKIMGYTVTAYPETKDFGTYPETFIGQDSALAEVGLVAGVTYTSAAYKNAVLDGFTALIGGGLVSEGVKGEDQLLLELLPTMFPGMANPEGVLQAELLEGNQRVWKALNDSGFAMLLEDGEHFTMGLVNAFGGVKVYDVEGNDVTADTDEASLAILRDYGLNNIVSHDAEDAKKLSMMIDAEGPALEPITLEDTFGTVTSAYKLTAGEEVYYAFAARPYAYSNIPVAVYYVVDTDGAIYAMNCSELILHGEYFTTYELNEKEYKAGFGGLNAETWTGDQALISGATMTSNAITAATDDIFAAFETISVETTEGGDAE